MIPGAPCYSPPPPMTPSPRNRWGVPPYIIGIESPAAEYLADIKRASPGQGIASSRAFIGCAQRLYQELRFLKINAWLVGQTSVI